MSTPQPPTRLTVSGGPKVEPHLSQRTIERPTRDPYRMAHPSTRLVLMRKAEAFGVSLLIIGAIVLYLVFDGGVR